MDVTRKHELVRAEIHRIHPLEQDVAGGSGHLSYSRLGDVVVGKTAKDGSFTFAAEVGLESEFGGSTHWFRGTIVPVGESRVDSLPSVTQQYDGDFVVPEELEAKKGKKGRKGPKPRGLSAIRSTRRELGLPVLGANACREVVRGLLKEHLKVPDEDFFDVKCRTAQESIEGCADRFRFAALKWDGQERAAALWYVGIVTYNLKTDKATAKIRRHAKSGELVRHPNFNHQDLEKGEERIWADLGFPREKP